LSKQTVEHLLFGHHGRLDPPHDVEDTI